MVRVPFPVVEEAQHFCLHRYGQLHGHRHITYWRDGCQGCLICNSVGADLGGNDLIPFAVVVGFGEVITLVHSRRLPLDILPKVPGVWV